MHYVIVGFSYKNAPLEVREKLNLTAECQQIEFMKALICQKSVNEVMIENTCNRIEILASVNHIEYAVKAIKEGLKARSGLDESMLDTYADIYKDESAIHHLFTVAASLDSLVIGETQIVGQLRDAFKLSLEHNFCSKKISQALQHAFKCAAEVRSATHISSKPVSIASIAVLKAKERIGSLDGVKALVIGSGDMSRIACQHLRQHKAEVTLLNRTQEKAQAIADEINDEITVAPFDQLGYLVNESQLLITATSAKSAIICEDVVQSRNFHRVWFDLAVPRDIAPLTQGNIELFVVDDLEDIAKSNIEFRKEEAKSSYAIISRYTDDFFSWLQGMQVEPLLKSIYERALQSAAIQTDKAIEKGFISEHAAEQTHKLSTQVVKHFLHDMSKKLRDVAHKPEAEEIMDTLSYLFDINDTSRIMPSCDTPTSTNGKEPE